MQNSTVSGNNSGFGGGVGGGGFAGEEGVDFGRVEVDAEDVLDGRDDGFALFLAPTVADRMFPAIPAPNGGSLASRARSVLASVR